MFTRHEICIDKLSTSIPLKITLMFVSITIQINIQMVHTTLDGKKLIGGHT